MLSAVYDKSFKNVPYDELHTDCLVQDHFLIILPLYNFILYISSIFHCSKNVTVSSDAILNQTSDTENPFSQVN